MAEHGSEAASAAQGGERSTGGPVSGRRAIELNRSLLVEMFFERGDLDRAEQAERELPEHIDPMAHADALRRLGIDPGLLLTQVDGLEA